MKHFTSLALAGCLAASAAMPAPAQAQSSDDIVRTIVQIADVVFRDGQPYYRYGSNERLVSGRDQYGRTVYYRVNDYGFNSYGQTTVITRDAYGRPLYYRSGGDYGSGYYDGSWQGQGSDTTRCNTNGWCTRTYYDPRYDRTQGRYYRMP